MFLKIFTFLSISLVVLEEANASGISQRLKRQLATLNPCKLGSPAYNSHPTDHQKYIQCTESGVMIIMDCAPGTVWNPVKGTCTTMEEFKRDYLQTPAVQPTYFPLVKSAMGGKTLAVANAGRGGYSFVSADSGRGGHNLVSMVNMKYIKYPLGAKVSPVDSFNPPPIITLPYYYKTKPVTHSPIILPKPVYPVTASSGRSADNVLGGIPDYRWLDVYPSLQTSSPIHFLPLGTTDPFPTTVTTLPGQVVSSIGTTERRKRWENNFGIL